MAQGPLRAAGGARGLGRAILAVEARLALARFRPRTVGVTGTVGKTGAQEAITAVLAVRHQVRAGVEDGSSWPHVVLGLDAASPAAVRLLQGLGRPFSRSYPDWLVLEMGVSRPGDMRPRIGRLSFDVAVLTRLGDRPPHLEAFGTRERLLEETVLLLRALKRTGIAIVNGDDAELLAAVRRDLRGRRLVTYGFGPGADVRARDVSITYAAEGAVPEGMRFAIEERGASVTEVRLAGVLGRPPVYAGLAAAAVGRVMDMSPGEVARGLSRQTFRPGRMRILEGAEGSVILDDTWNSSPIGVEEALVAMRELRARGRKVVVLGEMLGLGPLAHRAHDRVARQAVSVADRVFFVGDRAAAMSASALGGGGDPDRLEILPTPHAAGSRLRDFVGLGDVVLVEGSAAGRGMEEAVERFMMHPERRAELLVRGGIATS